MKLFPAFFLMEKAHIVVFGGGEEALRKIRLVAKTPARLSVVTNEPSAALLAEFPDRFDLLATDQAEQVIAGATFSIIALDNDEEANWAINLAKSHGVSVNAVDRPQDCDFTVPSILERGELVAAVGSGGAAPVLAKSVRAKLETLLPSRMAELSRFAKALRPAVYEALDTFEARRQFWEAALNGVVAERVLEGDEEGALTLAHEMLAGGKPDGVVHIVGAGPGDPELLTVKALRIIQNADIVYYDRLISDEIMDLVRRDARRVAVGKCKGNHLVPQSHIQDLLIASAREGLRVVRLKGGDPFIFGRGGEELAALQAANVDAFTVPGISSALGCAASAGVPLTHRDHAQSLTFVTGHAKSGGVPDVDWEMLSRPGQTVVIFMGVGTSSQITARLIEAGQAPDIPVAIIENGTRANEKRLFGTLSELPDLIKSGGIVGPALLIIGEVAGLAIEALVDQAMETAA